MKVDVNAIWKGFEEKVLSKDATEIQKSEMRMAFVAGLSLGGSLMIEGEQTADCMLETLTTLNEAGAEYAQGETALNIYKKHEGVKDGN